jgi:acyl-CoA dehydrogenase
MDEFTRQAREFLDAHADRTPDKTHFTWGEGDDSVAYFSADPPEAEQRKLKAARDWQRTRYGCGFGWISGPREYGGRGLTPVHGRWPRSTSPGRWPS